MSRALEDFVRAEVAVLGFDLVEFRTGGIRARPLLDVRIDRTDGSRVTLDDCAAVSRAVEPRLEESGLVGSSYVLEVSSPGVERPLRNSVDWRRFIGRRAKVLSAALGGRVEVEIVGLEADEGSDVAVVRDSGGVERRIPFSDIREARLVFRWNH
ncbi:MAG: Ribosome maturation factor RimP [Gemmatimonadaceae bacterium]|nr:Ribosome maturation factor RimP [Gemmatimonadaceae bacterium]